jgi:RNA polymerase sigma factor (sigma-70 family)
MAADQIAKVVDHLRRVLGSQEEANLSDSQLLDLFLTQGDERGFAGIVQRHGGMVWRVCRRILPCYQDAEDAFQATFFVLIRKAASLSSRGLLANWLYGVARRTALKLKATSIKRQIKEKPFRDLPAVEQQECWDDVKTFLDLELSRLPVKYRTAVLLCDLQGKTRKEAARLLGLPEGTVAGRLARARSMLAKRLVRHGFTLSAGAVLSQLQDVAASSRIPSTLASNALKNFRFFQVGGTAGAAVISPRVLALTSGVLRSMLLTKLRIAMITLVTVITVIFAARTLIASGTLPPSREFPEPGAQEAKDTSLWEVVQAYRYNDAKGDERFTGKNLRVSGLISKIRRIAKSSSDDTCYYLVGLSAEYKNETGKDMISSDSIAFRFEPRLREQLSVLLRYQRITIEGRCQGRTAQPGENIVTFTDCKIIATTN